MNVQVHWGRLVEGRDLHSQKMFGFDKCMVAKIQSEIGFKV